MKHKKKMNFKRIFLRVFAAFLAFYIGIMSLFTVVQYNNSKQEYGSRRIMFLDYIEDCIPMSSEFGTEEQDYPIRSSLSYLWTMIRESICINETYMRAALYTEEGEVIARTGNFITCAGINLVSQEIHNKQIPNKQNYKSYFALVDIDKYLSTEQIKRLCDLKKQESNTLKYGMQVTGYLYNGEVIPTKITIDKEYWKPDTTETNNKIVYIDNKIVDSDNEIVYSATLQKKERIEEYTFNPKGVEGLESHYFDHCHLQIEKMCLSGILSNSDDYLFRKQNRDEKTITRYEECTPVLTQENKEEAKEHTTTEIYESTLLKDKVQSTQYLEIEGKGYYLVVNSVSYPLEVTLQRLVIIYLLFLAIVIVLTGILSAGIWKNYKKQLLLEKQRREFIDAIGHELKTPLGIIRTYSEGLKENISEEKRGYYLEVIMDETDKMDELVLEMLDLSNLEAKAYVLKKEVFNLNHLIEEVLKNKEKLFEDKQIQVDFRTDGEQEIVADYKRMYQVINNFTMNAIAHTPLGGKIVIQIEKGIVSIENEGECIKEEEMDLVWNSFYKGEKEKCQRGTGLGLAIVKNILELHNMAYGVKNIQKGVRFWFKYDK